MKVLHVVGGDLSRGAARGAYWLHAAERGLGIDSRLLTNSANTVGDPSVVSLASSPVREMCCTVATKLAKSPVLLYPRRKPWIFNTGVDGIDITRLAAYKDADIIHLHWINGLVRVGAMPNIDKPVVWTLRDMWPFTGGCHYSMDCTRFEIGCGRCPMLGSGKDFDLTSRVVGYKTRSLPKRMHLIAISRWLAESAKRSQLLGSYPVQTISNCVDLRHFYPVDASVARAALDIPESKYVVLVVAQSIEEFYKGFDLFLESLKSLSGLDIHVLLAGRIGREEIVATDLPVTSLGFVKDADRLRQVYSAANVFVAPSRMDAFGKTLVEAMACGTPVVCFDATGPKEIVEHRVSGYKARPFEPEDLAAGIRWVLEREPSDLAALKDRSRSIAEERFSSEVIAREYGALYRNILG